jgi:hypothetical protein
MIDFYFITAQNVINLKKSNMFESLKKPDVAIDTTAVMQCVNSMPTTSALVYFTKFHTSTDSRFFPDTDYEQAVLILEQSALRLKAIDGEELALPLTGFKFKVDLKKLEIIFRTKQFVYFLSRTITLPELESLGTFTGKAIDQYVANKTENIQTITDFLLNNGAIQKKHIWYGLNWF